MIRRLYVHNFRCLENFELSIADRHSVLLIGNNGSGKTTVALALEILQKIARGTNRISDLVKSKDLTRGRTDVPVRFEIEVELKAKIYEYIVAFDFPEGFKELRVLEEKLIAGGKPVYTRTLAEVHLARTGRNQDQGARFHIDWHLVALPIVQEQSQADPLFVFRQWLARMLILRPVPGSIAGDSQHETLEPNLQVTDFGAGRLFKFQVQGTKDLETDPEDTWQGVSFSEAAARDMAERCGFELRYQHGAGSQDYWLWLFKTREVA